MHLEEKFWEEQMNSVMKTLAEKGKKIREEILQAIILYIEQHGYPTTTREIGEMVGLKSTSSVHAHLQRLLREGKIETDAGLGVPRAIRIPGYKFTKVAE